MDYTRHVKKCITKMFTLELSGNSLALYLNKRFEKKHWSYKRCQSIAIWWRLEWRRSLFEHTILVKTVGKNVKTLTLSWRRPISCRNQSIDLRSKSMDWFLYDNGLRHGRVKTLVRISSSRIETECKDSIL